jgi:hypothetical protein
MCFNVCYHFGWWCLPLLTLCYHVVWRVVPLVLICVQPCVRRCVSHVWQCLQLCLTTCIACFNDCLQRVWWFYHLFKRSCTMCFDDISIVFNDCYHCFWQCSTMCLRLLHVVWRFVINGWRCIPLVWRVVPCFWTCFTNGLTIVDHVFRICRPCVSYMLTMCFVYVEPCFSYMLTMRQPEINYKKVGARTQHSLVRNRICLSTLRTCIPHRCGVIFESTLRTRDPHPSKSKLWTGLKQVELRPILKRIGTCCGFFRGGSEYGNPVAIWEMLHNSKITNLIGNNNKHQI